MGGYRYNRAPTPSTSHGTPANRRESAWFVLRRVVVALLSIGSRTTEHAVVEVEVDVEGWGDLALEESPEGGEQVENMEPMATVVDLVRLAMVEVTAATATMVVDLATAVVMEMEVWVRLLVDMVVSVVVVVSHNPQRALDHPVE